MKKILMIAYHFPPLAGSSGIQRTLRFVQHLPHYGWQPLVLAASPRAYERTSDDLNQDIPPGTVLRRAFALDTARHLAIGGRYVGAMARPDRWVSWRFDAVRQGMQMIREYRPDAIWSTYPIATAHLIGAELQRRSGLPWIADFRDPMAQEGYPADPVTRVEYQRIERLTLEHARLSVFATPSAASTYQRRYPHCADRVRVIENGFDEESFNALPTPSSGKWPELIPGCLTLLHSGIVYPSERDPTQLMQALKLLHNSHRIVPGQLVIRFRASMADGLLAQLTDAFGIKPYIQLCPPVNYREALSEMMRADGLLILQAANCNEQIPAKLYEYLRCGRPLLGLTDPNGDTAATLNAAGIGTIAPLDSAEAIAALLMKFIKSGPEDMQALPDPVFVAGSSRRERTQSLAAVLQLATDTKAG